jgi:hypothetical protein
MKVAPQNVWLKPVIDLLLSAEHDWQEVDTSGQPNMSAGEAHVALNRSTFLPEFERKSLPFNEVVSGKAAPPNVSFKPETMCEQFEYNELMTELGKIDDATGEHKLSLGPSAWRTRFVKPGLVLHYACEGDDVLWCSFGGVWSTRLWPVEVKTSARGVLYFSLAKASYVSALTCRPLICFSDVSVVELQFICPLVWFVLHDCRPQYSTVPDGALWCPLNQCVPKRVPLLVRLATCGFRDFGLDDMQLLCALELGLTDSILGHKLPTVVYEATRKVLECDSLRAADIVEARFCTDTSHDHKDTMATLTSETARWCAHNSARQALTALSSSPLGPHARDILHLQPSGARSP